MAERKETIVYQYTGHCPECGAKQEGRTETIADRVCDTCREKHAAERFEAGLVFLKGAKIIDFKGKCYVRSTGGSMSTCVISELIVLTADGRTINITTSRGLWREVEV